MERKLLSKGTDILEGRGKEIHLGSVLASSSEISAVAQNQSANFFVSLLSSFSGLLCRPEAASVGDKVRTPRQPWKCPPYYVFQFTR